MGKYSTDSVMRSERAYEVLQMLLEKKESYATEISKELDMDRSMASEILSKLEELSIIKVSKRKQAKYYKIDPEGLFKEFDSYWKVFDDDNRDAELKVLTGKIPQTENDIQELYNSKMPIFLSLYVYQYTREFDNSSIEKMLTEDFYDIVRDFSEAKQILGTEYPDWLKNVLNRIIILEVLEKRDSFYVLRRAVSNYSHIMDKIEDKNGVADTFEILEAIEEFEK
jgi:predicted transcriptional regulator